jgi:hypothetical protein
MFMDSVQTTRAELALVDERTGLFANPPDGLLAAIAWEGSTDEEVTVLMVWDTPGARGDFSVKMMPLVEAGDVTSKPTILTPHKVYLRNR